MNYDEAFWEGHRDGYQRRPRRVYHPAPGPYASGYREGSLARPRLHLMVGCYWRLSCSRWELCLGPLTLGVW